jgi:hypothetical protein
MMDVDVLVVGLLEDLAARIASSVPPSWPVPIFEAEASLYPFFIRRLLTGFDAVAHRDGTEHVADLLRTPGRAAEFAYLLLGVRESNLDVSERRRLAAYLAYALRDLRPDDPLCRHGKNRLLPADRIRKAVSGSNEVGPRDLGDVRRLRAALLSLAEFLHVGIPQYGREVHGPYELSGLGHAIVWSHLDLRMEAVWASSAQLAVDEVHVIEVYESGADCVRFDLTNHVVVLPRRAEPRFARVYGVNSGACSPIHDVEALLADVLTAIDRLEQAAKTFTRADWLRRHLEARHWCIRSCAQRARLPWRPTHSEYAVLDEPPRSDVMSVVAGPAGAVRTHLLRGLALEGEIDGC